MPESALFLFFLPYNYIKAEFFDFDMLECEEVKANESIEESKEAAENDEISTKIVDGDFEVSTVMHLKTEFAEVYRKFAQVCTELKLLYVAITRPKKLLLIYDDDNQMRVPL